MSSHDHIHTPLDGRGRRNIWLNGKLMSGVIYADTEKGIIKIRDDNAPVSTLHEPATRELHGVVEVKLWEEQTNG
jgi:hypothetical protein